MEKIQVESLIQLIRLWVTKLSRGFQEISRGQFRGLMPYRHEPIDP